jgi:Helix-turn-helix domain of resolvase
VFRLKYDFAALAGFAGMRGMWGLEMPNPAGEREGRVTGKMREAAGEIAPIRQDDSGHDAARHLAIATIGENACAIGVPVHFLGEEVSLAAGRDGLWRGLGIGASKIARRLKIGRASVYRVLQL